MSQVAIVFTIIIAALALFIWNRIPAVIVGIAVSLALLFTGILSGNEAVAGFGDPVVILIAAIFIVGEAVVNTGIAHRLGEAVLEAGHGNEARLIVVNEDNTVEVTHEALIHSWGTLREWIDSKREQLRVFRRLTDSAKEWEEAGRETS